MSDKENIILSGFHDAYEEKRKTFLDKRWNSFGSYYLRMRGNSEEYISLLTSETKFHKEMFEWLSGHIKNNDLTCAQIKEARLSLKLFKEKLNNRNVFLVLFAAIMAAAVTFNNLINELAGITGDIGIVVIVATFAFLAVVERGNIAKHVSLTEEFGLFLDKWLEINNKTTDEC